MQWGRWSRDNPGLLISSRGVIGRCMDEGAGASSATAGLYEIPMPNLVEITETIVLAMDEDIREAVIVRYVKRRTTREGSRDMHCGETEFRSRVNQGVAFANGYLSCLGLKLI